MYYDEAQQKQILREMEKDLLAIIAVNLKNDEYEVIYSDGAYKDFGNHYHKTDFFCNWVNAGLPLICEEDRLRMQTEISRKYLTERLKTQDAYYTVCRFMVDQSPAYCRIKAARNVLEEDVAVISIRNIDTEVRHDMESLAELERMRMKNFISQMHPHFLYNALSSIREIVLTDPEYGADMLYDFTTHLRASIRAMSNDDQIWFSQELENIKAYVSIEKMRFGDRLNVVYDIEGKDFMIIPLSIQPIVENAIKHGLYEKSESGGTVTLKTREKEDSWEISVTDDGIGFDPEEIRRQIDAGERDSTGLYNLIFRLNNMMNASVELNSVIGKGTTVLIRIPKGEEPK